jgi:hypothetical protein
VNIVSIFCAVNFLSVFKMLYFITLRAVDHCTPIRGLCRYVHGGKAHALIKMIVRTKTSIKSVFGMGEAPCLFHMSVLWKNTKEEANEGKARGPLTPMTINFDGGRALSHIAWTHNVSLHQITQIQSREPCGKYKSTCKSKSYEK